jgi:hypothetical protein
MRTRERWGLRDIGVAALIALGIAGFSVYLGLIIWVVVPMLRWMVAG